MGTLDRGAMFYFNKFVGFVISPIGITMLGGLSALLCAWFKRPRLAKWLVWSVVVWLWLWMTPIMTWVVGVPLEREFLVDGRVPTVETFPEADAIVLLGGSMDIETNLSSYAEMWTSADRVWQTARLYKVGKAPKIIATGIGARDTTLPLLKDFGLPGEVVEFYDARNTEEEAKRIEKMGYKKVLLVTSAWHTKRARLMFEKYASDVEVISAPADFENSMMAKRSFALRSLLPDFNAFVLNSVAFHEWVGIVGYKFLR